MHEPFGMETVSDAFTSVDLKKMARETQRQKRHMRLEMIRAMLGNSIDDSNCYMTSIAIKEDMMHEGN